MATHKLTYSSECWMLTKHDERRTGISEMRYLKSIAGYARNNRRRKTDIKGELKIYKLKNKKKEYR